MTKKIKTVKENTELFECSNCDILILEDTKLCEFCQKAKQLGRKEAIKEFEKIIDGYRWTREDREDIQKKLDKLKEINKNE